MKKWKWLLRIGLTGVLGVALCYVTFALSQSYQDCPFWLRDELARTGYQLAFKSNRDGEYWSYVMNADGSQPARVAPLTETDFRVESASMYGIPLISPTGRHIAFEDDGLWIADREMTKQQRLVHPAARVTGFSWSPDGRFLAIAEGVLTIADIERQRTRSLDGIGFIQVNGVPQWSADGRYIAFEVYHLRGRDAREAGLQNWEIYVLDVNTFQPCLLTASEAYSDRDPAWRPE
jgi:Tol biopolymer transport system component